MNFSRACDPIEVAKILVLAFASLLSLSSASWAQGSVVNSMGASNCPTADFDTSLNFASEPSNYYAIIVDKQNISGHSCIFDGPVYGPTFYPDRVSGDRPFALCYDCKIPLAQRTTWRPLTLDPGEVARQRFQWKTVPPNEGTRCLQPSWMSGPQLLLVAPSLLKQICSDIEVTRFNLAVSADSDTTEATDIKRVGNLKLFSDKNTYYQGETFSLRVSRTEPEIETPSKQNSCPTLYLRARSPDGTTRIDELQPLAFKGCQKAVLGHEPGDWNSGFDLDSGANSRWEGVGEHEFQVFQLADSTDESQIRFVSSSVLRIQIADPSLTQRRWGQRVKGVAADVTLDKDTYRLGEDIPLHLAIEDFAADVPLFSWDQVWDPCMVVGIEVQDAAGHPLGVNERFPHSSICTGHGFGPRPLPKGKIVPIERNLRAEGWLPNRPGTYNVVVSWAPCFGRRDDLPSGKWVADLKPYAVVHATATIHVLSE